MINRTLFIMLAGLWLAAALLMALPFGMRYIITSDERWDWYENSWAMRAFRWLGDRIDDIE